MTYRQRNDEASWLVGWMVGWMDARLNAYRVDGRHFGLRSRAALLAGGFVVALHRK